MLWFESGNGNHFTAWTYQRFPAVLSAWLKAKNADPADERSETAGRNDCEAGQTANTEVRYKVAPDPDTRNGITGVWLLVGMSEEPSPDNF